MLLVPLKLINISLIAVEYKRIFVCISIVTRNVNSVVTENCQIKNCVHFQLNLGITGLFLKIQITAEVDDGEFLYTYS